MNFKRKSTVGWSIFNVLMDFTGGFLSLLQTIIDGIIKGNWDLAGGTNSVKFGLGLLSMCFDVIFLFQHYVIYPQGGKVHSHLEVQLLNHQKKSCEIDRDTLAQVSEPIYRDDEYDVHDNEDEDEGDCNETGENV